MKQKFPYKLRIRNSCGLFVRGSTDFRQSNYQANLLNVINIYGTIVGLINILLTVIGDQRVICSD